MIDLWNAVQWLESSFKYWQSVCTPPEILPWSALLVMLLTLAIFLPVMRRRKQIAASEWRRTLAARARA
jgi:hypothetical protein